jgi:hypothetical protein
MASHIISSGFPVKILAALPLVAALAVTAPLAAHAEDEGLTPAKAEAFNARVFGGRIGAKASACFVRHYDATHLAQHRKQKVSSMKLLLTADNKPDEGMSYAYKAGIRFRDRPGNFDAASGCGQIENGDKEIRFTCDADCGGGGIEVGMSEDNKSAIVHLDVIGVYDRKHPKRDPISLEGGADDKLFRLDRVDASECAELMPGHKEVASVQRE